MFIIDGLLLTLYMITLTAHTGGGSVLRMINGLLELIHISTGPEAFCGLVYWTAVLLVVI